MFPTKWGKVPAVRGTRTGGKGQTPAKPEGDSTPETSRRRVRPPSSHSGSRTPAPSGLLVLLALITSLVLTACSLGEEDEQVGVAVTVDWSTACVELWDGNELLAISSFVRAHMGEWGQPREGEYFCELALPQPPTIRLPSLAPGIYQVCDQNRSDCRQVMVPEGEG